MKTGRSGLVKAGGALFIFLGGLFWLTFYLNLPANFGLNVVGDSGSYGPDMGADGGSGNPFDRAVKLFILFISIIVIASRWSLARAVIRNMNPGFLVVMLLIPLSTFWSIVPPATVLRFVTLLTTVLLSLALCLTGWNRRRLQQLATPPLMYIVVVSLVVGMLYPDRIIETGDDLSLKNAWHGITLTKNQFGMISSLGVIFCAYAWLAREGRALWAIAGTLVAGTCLVLSRSNTSLFATLVSVAFIFAMTRMAFIRRMFSTLLVVSIGSVLVLYQLVIQNLLPGAYTLLGPIRALTGKDATLSARTMIWDIVKQHIEGAPWLGTGYGAYWLGPENSPSAIFMYVMYFYPSEAHNGYLDIVNDLGYVGLVCLIAFLAAYVWQGLKMMQYDTNQATLYLALLFQQMVMNMSESEWFARDSIFAVIILGICCMARAQYERGQELKRMALAVRRETSAARPPGPPR